MRKEANKTIGGCVQTLCPKVFCRLIEAGIILSWKGASIWKLQWPRWREASTKLIWVSWTLYWVFWMVGLMKCRDLLEEGWRRLLLLTFSIVFEAITIWWDLCKHSNFYLFLKKMKEWFFIEWGFTE